MIYGIVFADYIDDVKKSYERGLNGKEELYIIDADFKFIAVNRTYEGIETVEINAENIYLASGKFTFLPESLKLSLSYSSNLNNLIGSSDRETAYIDTGLNLFSDNYFRLRFNYFNHRFTSIIKNNNNFEIVVEDKRGNHPGQYDREYIKANDEYKTNDSFYTRNSLIIVSNYTNVKNYGLTYAIEEGSKPHLY